MAEQLTLTAATKEERYAELMPQLTALIEGESDLIANLANVAAALHEAWGHLWTGFYLVKTSPDNLNTLSNVTRQHPERAAAQLVLGPFQGPLACTRIRYGHGVCGTSWARRQTLIVPDVECFPGHIACNSASRSEIVVPIFSPTDRRVLGVLDIDSDHLDTFDETDRMYLEQLAAKLGTCW